MGPQDGAKTAPRQPQDSPKMAKMASHRILNVSQVEERSHGIPKMRPRGTQEAPKRPQEASRGPQEASKSLPRGPQEAPRGHLGAIPRMAPRRAKEGPKRAARQLQDGSAIAPRWPQDASKSHRIAILRSRGPSDGIPQACRLQCKC